MPEVVQNFFIIFAIMPVWTFAALTRAAMHYERGY